MSDTHSAYGGTFGGTHGGSAGLTYGARRPPGFTVELTDRNHNTRAIAPSRILSASVDLNHTQLSGFDVSVPADRSFEDWLRAEADIYIGDSLVFRGVLLQCPSPLEGDGETTLQGTGRGHFLTRGHYEIPLDPDRECWDAIQFIWDEFSEFTATVHAPPEGSRVRVPDESVEGSPMDILKELHEHAGMRFTINHRAETPRAESYFRAQIEKPATWTYLNGEVERDATEYANRVIVRGAKVVEGGTTRYTGTATNQQAVDQRGEIESVTIDDRGLTSEQACLDRAVTELPGYLAADATTGTLQVLPTMILPGYAYPVSEFAMDGDTPTQELESVSISESFGTSGDAECQLDFSGERSLVKNLKGLHRRQQRLSSRL